MDARGGELSGEVVLRVQERGVLEVDGNRVAAQDLRCAPRSAWSLLLHHHLVRTANTGHKESVSALQQALAAMPVSVAAKGGLSTNDGGLLGAQRRARDHCGCVS